MNSDYSCRVTSHYHGLNSWCREVVTFENPNFLDSVAEEVKPNHKRGRVKSLTVRVDFWVKNPDGTGKWVASHSYEWRR